MCRSVGAVSLTCTHSHGKRQHLHITAVVVYRTLSEGALGPVVTVVAVALPALCTAPRTVPHCDHTPWTRRSFNRSNNIAVIVAKSFTTTLESVA